MIGLCWNQFEFGGLNVLNVNFLSVVRLLSYTENIVYTVFCCP